MFGFRDKDKEKLEENMEDIKELINQGKGGENTSHQKDSDSTEDAQTGDIEGLEEELQSFEDQPQGQKSENTPETQTFSDNTNSQDNTKQPLNSTESQNQSFEENFGETEHTEPDTSQSPVQQNSLNPEGKPQEEPHREPQKEQASRDNRGIPETGRRKQEAREQKQAEQRKQRRKEQREEKPRGRNNLGEQVPKPPKTKKLDVPEIDKGPLFIKRKKFERAQEMIHEMRYISQEIDQVINRLENGIKEDQETEREAKELLHALEKDRGSVKDIISPEKTQ